MKIKSIRIENFRSFLDETINLNRYSCFVGPNGVGKSSILAALNVFFREQASSTTDVVRLTDEDYFNKITSNPIRITVTFDDLSTSAQAELAAYVRQNELVVTVEAVFDPNCGFGETRHFGQRMGMAEFHQFFDAEKTGARVAELNTIFERLREQFPDLPNPRSKDDKINALHNYESTHSERCILIPSEDNFYGINSTGKLSAFAQWVFVPAVKDAAEEGQESRNTALGKLITRAVRTRVNFDTELETLKSSTLTSYRELLQRNQASLTDLSDALQRRLQFWAHPNVRVGMEWLSDPNKAVMLQQPIAGIKTGEGGFLGSLSRMGHGLQRSYLLALLQELAGSDIPDSPTLILGCEEPELYQHPPQARYLADVLSELSKGNNQIIVTTHSPLFVNGDGFEHTRLVRRTNAQAGTNVRGLTYQNLCARIRGAMGENPQRQNEGLIAKIRQALQPGIAEMFFARVPILVEGLEDISYITTQLHLSGLWVDFRRSGCHLISTNGKNNLVQSLAIAIELGMPVFTMFDADDNIVREDQRVKHQRENTALISLLGAVCNPFPDENVWGENYIIWRTNLSDVVKTDFAANYDRLTEVVRLSYSQEGGLEKNDLFIADWVSAARAEDLQSTSLERVCRSILNYANTLP